MRHVLTGLTALAAAACVDSPGGDPGSPPPAPRSNSGIVAPGQRDKIPDTPYEVRKSEIERDRAIAGQAGPTYPPLFKNQKANAGQDGGS